MTFATVNGVTLHYSWQPGTGVPLVFLNSLGSDFRIWNDTLAQLDSGRPVLLYDKRGHGLSDAPTGPGTLQQHADDLLALLDLLGIERAVLAGVSVGGMIALQFAAARPDRVAGLILCDTAAVIGTPGFWNDRIALIGEQGLQATAGNIIERWFTPQFAAAQPAAVLGYRNMLGRTPQRGYIATCEAIRDADLRPLLPLISAPALVIFGAQDEATPPAAGRELAAALPGASYSEIAQAGHLPGVEQPAQLARLISSFLAQQEPESDRYQRGMAKRRKVLGDAHVDNAEATKTAFDSDFQEFITRYAWGDAWQRGVLTERERHLVTLTLLAALGQDHEFAMHVRATVNTGVSRQQVREILHQAAIYAGVPAANTAFTIARNEFERMDAQNVQSDQSAEKEQ
jgi:3-oxoadipate enol-lactonase/4-carboxymuconolactone decarboxylase